MIYQVVLRRRGRDVGTLFWDGPLCETKKLARVVALQREADIFLVTEVDDSGAVVYSEQRPFDGKVS